MTRNPNKDPISKIKDWLRKQETEDEIPIKSRDRVYTKMARDIRKIKPLPGGVCNICGSHSEKLLPMTMKVCLNCAKKFMNKAGGLRVLRKDVETYYCDNCFGKAFATLTVNPMVCEKCLRRIGKFHKFNIRDLRRKRMLDEKRVWSRFYTNWG